MTTVAVLGTGIMGAPMARNLAKNGHQVKVWNRTRDKALPLQADGITVSSHPAEAVTGADVVITMLSDGDAVHAAMSAAAPGLAAGQVWAQMSTVGLVALDRLAALAREHGLIFADAPVQGTRQPAEAGTLVVLAAGPADERLEPVFSAVGARTIWVGEEVGAATRLKLTTVGYAITLTAVLAESLALLRALGLDPSLFAEVVTGSALDSGYVQTKMKSIRDGDYTPSFTVRNAEKDTRLIAEAASGAGVQVDMAVAAGERFRRAEAQGHGDDDMAAGYFASFPTGSPTP
ncbi:NAD(P)-dependent oxidoreductase [Spongiactinospora rosea]|uniref:NAD(P)-dependent oxidoreductase n=1 Tax=Spongiactinospora rosea TaxID=2248750 RepID=A0A366M1M7_9ACTN|nr:NAD(P)-dependent oxidoreductase [Spongiactinospora rosea]RBQ19713.1 NAD(P)-dependent oxidoreductase [Spongiactinospora rosea]